MDATIDIVLDDAFDVGDVTVLNGKHSAEYGSGNARRNLQRTRRFGTIANHTSQVGYHVLYRIGNLVVGAAHQIGDAAAGAGSSHDAAAEGRQFAKALLDVDGGEVAQDEGAGDFLFGVVVLLAKDDHGQGGSDALVAAARIAHHGNHGSGHTCIAGRRGLRQDVAEDGLAHDATAQRSAQRLAEFVTIIATERNPGCILVEATCLVDELKLFKRRSGGELIDLAKGQLVVIGFFVKDV